MMIRCHNKDHHLRTPLAKTIYLSSLQETLSIPNREYGVQIHAFCIMDNHVHLFETYKNGSKKLSNFFRDSHTRCGMRINKAFQRSGNFGQGRPLTPVIQDNAHQARVHMYIEANPIRAGVLTLEQLRNYKYSSYGFYAFGIKTAFTELLTIPQWYLELGNTPQERQQAYRKLFQKYLLEKPIKPKGFTTYFIGEGSWSIQKEMELLQRLKQRKGALNQSSQPKQPG